MKSETFHALIIDRHFGELPPETAELLELHLQSDAAARSEAGQILQSLDCARQAVLQHPELAQVAPEERASRGPAAAPRWMPVASRWLARAAAMVLLAAAAGAAGYLAGSSRSNAQTAAVTQTQTLTPPQLPPTPMAPLHESPWARYRVTFDPVSDGIKIVRVNTPNSESEGRP